MNVALVAFHGEVGPLVDHSWERTSIKENGLLSVKACFGEQAALGMYPSRSVT